VRALEAATRRLAFADDRAEVPDSAIREMHTLGQAMQAMADEIAVQRHHQLVLLAGVSHDLRTPLSRMKMAIGMAEEVLPDGIRQRLESDIAEMDLLIGAQLALSRARQVEAGQRIDLKAVLQEWVDAELAMSPVPIRLRFGGHIGEWTVASTALRRLLANLIQNATRYGAREVQVVLRRCGRGLSIGVRDDGPGIAAELRDAVFRPFYRIDASRQRASGGAGLGLAIARQLAETHGWTLRLVNRARPGCSFWLRIR
jgi:two-component system osmolarity sensor histidine kinase EnvZ